MENILIKPRVFKLPGKKKLMDSDRPIKTIIIDVTEFPIERPKKSRKNFIQVKRNIIRSLSQVIAQQETGQIICTKFVGGKQHDFKIFKASKLALKEELKCLGARGY